MHSISSSSITGKYERGLTLISYPARRKSSSVASCRLPLGNPNLSFMAGSPVLKRGPRKPGGTKDPRRRLRPPAAPLCCWAALTGELSAIELHLHSPRLL